MKPAKRAPQWDDWRCYRCNKWQPSHAPRTNHTTPVGITVSVCAECAKKDALR